MKTVSFDKERIGKFVADKLGIGSPSNFGEFQCIGVDEDGEIIGGAVYADCNGVNCCVHIAGTPGKLWLTKDFLRYGFDYPFNQLKLNRLTGWVEGWNKEALRLDLHLGYEIEATLQGAARDGGDVYIVRMFKKDCRFLKGKYAL